jgi:hypothetical protein
MRLRDVFTPRTPGNDLSGMRHANVDRESPLHCPSRASALRVAPVLSCKIGVGPFVFARAMTSLCRTISSASASDIDPAVERKVFLEIALRFYRPRPHPAG